MSKTKILWLSGLILGVLFSACAPPVAPTQPAAVTQPGLPTPMVAAPTDIPTSTLLPATGTAAPATEPTNPTPIAAATSRGPNLEATDPATVQLASGGLQLVEFFRFT